MTRLTMSPTTGHINVKRERLAFGTQASCKFCGQDIEWHGREVGWIDRGAGRDCLPYTDRKTHEIVHPTTKHARYKP